MKPILFPRCQWGPLSAWRLQLLADTLISQTSHSSTSHYSRWVITRPFRLRERSVGWRHMGAKCQLPDLKTYLTSVYTDWNMLIWETPGGKKKKKKSFNTDQNRLGNETLADAALTWQMGNEIVELFLLCPSICSTIHPSSDLSSSSRKGPVGNASHLKLLGQLSWDFTLHPRRLWLQSQPAAEPLTSLCQRAVHSATPRVCHTLDSHVSACVCIKQPSDTCNCGETWVLVSQSCMLTW